MSARPGPLTADRLRQVLSYSPETGRFHWRMFRGSRAAKGRRAGSVRQHGYRSVRIDGHPYFEHRLAWLYVHGEWPVDQIDHINGQTGDNRMANLRPATMPLNKQNERRARTSSRSGLLGIAPSKNGSRWRAQIVVRGQQIPLGVFDSPTAAHAAYIEAKRRLHPFGVL